MNLNLFKNIPGPGGQDLERLRQDNERMRTSDVDTAEMKDLLTGKVRKPRAVRDWEKLQHRG